MIVRALILALALAAPVHAAAAVPTRAGLTVWPARMRLAAGATSAIHIANGSRRTQLLDVRVAGFALDVRGEPRIVRPAGSPHIAVQARRLAVPAGATVSVVVRALPPHDAAPGDHPALVLLTAQPAGGPGIGVRVRIGVSVEVRVPGAVRRRLELGALRVRGGRALEVVVTNRGNVAERISGGALVLRVWRHRRLVAVLRPRARDLLPASRGIVEFRSSRRFRGRLTVVATVRGTAGERSYAVVA